MVQNYNALLRQIRDMRSKYPQLSIEEKLLLLKLDMKINGKYIMPNEAVTKADKKKEKSKRAKIRKYNSNNNIENK